MKPTALPRLALFALLTTLALPALAEKGSRIRADTPEPTRFAVRGSAIVDRTQKDAPQFFRGIGYSPYMRGESPLLNSPLPHDARYVEHLELVRGLNANFVHVFPQRMPEEFFVALDQADLFYGQDIWVEQRFPDFLSDEFQQATLTNVRAIIDHNYAVGRPDRLVMFSIGDELNPSSIAGTDQAHPEVREFQGKHLVVTGRTPTEVALARLVDAAIDYELARYGRRHLYCHTSFTHVGPLVRPDLELPPESALMPDMGDLVCLNVYTYARGVLTSGPGSVTETTYQGYLEDLAKATDKPVFITQVGLSTSPFEPKPWVPGFGGHKVADVPQTFRSIWRDIRTARGHERFTGVAFFELQDEWWKSGEGWERDSLSLNDDDPEEWFGLYSIGKDGRLVPKGPIPEVVRELFTAP